MSTGASRGVEEAVADNREALEAWADSDLPLAEEVEELLRQIDERGDSE